MFERNRLTIENVDPEIFAAIQQEDRRQEEHIEPRAEKPALRRAHRAAGDSWFTALDGDCRHSRGENGWSSCRRFVCCRAGEPPAPHSATGLTRFVANL